MLQLKEIVKPISREFRRSNCGFDHEASEDFVKSQWQSRTKSTNYLVYRWIVAAFFFAAVITSVAENELGWFYCIYLTVWGIWTCMLTNLLGAILVTLWHFHPETEKQINERSSVPTTFTIFWCAHVTTITLALSITIIYWSVIYEEGTAISATNILTHAFNATFMFLDFLIVAYPIRLQHIFIPILFGFLYALFSIIYYACGGTDAHGKVYIYSVLNWTEPQYALLTLFGVSALICFLHLILFFLYKLRVRVSKKVLRPLILPTSTVVQYPPSGISMVLGNYGHENRGFSGSTEKIPS